MLISTALVTLLSGAPPPCTARPEWTLVLHGGAGAWEGSARVLERRKAIARAALLDGAKRLARGESAVDVVEAVIVRLEDAPEFNAGRGGIPNREGFVELDAAIMRGRDLDAGAVAGLRRVKNPIRLARRVMENSPHVMFVDRGALAFAKAQAQTLVEPSYFLVPRTRPKTKSKAGTVGAVVADRCGEVAAGTSTGGYDAKMPGRVGDVPVIGAGTYANHATAAISATGWGEWFIRYTAAHDVSARMMYAKTPLDRAIVEVLSTIKRPKGAIGGMIAVTPGGQWSAAYTSKGMMRGVATHEGGAKVGIFETLD